MPEHPTDYRSYLLRLWRAHADAPWRFSLEDTLTHEVRTFTEIETLSIHLRDVTTWAVDRRWNEPVCKSGRSAAGENAAPGDDG